MCKPDGLSGHVRKEKLGIDAHFFEEGQLVDLEDDDVEEEEVTEDVEVEGIDVVIWKKKNGLLVVPQEHKLEVLHQHHDHKVAGHWGRHRTEELVSRNFTQDKWSQDVARYVAGYVNC